MCLVRYGIQLPFVNAYFAEHNACVLALLCSDTDYMIALALQQEDASALASASPTQPDLAGDEAVAMALLSEDRALLEQQRIGGGNDDTTLAAGRQGVPVREDRDRFAEPINACLECFGSPTLDRSPFCIPAMHASYLGSQQ